ncbi:Por secretion system C-terminal sorting domain-containing protein [Ekhidna lutea]|uniref:Por secretion system C-terminal sorting domain-containing protein n=1 Tax=Ekhidna lutea TaxID=447679 RepID=A0A239KC21_EKHLU|nr:T9SS type A sorting domain-containing protein [Ekhidna lutea]SNT15242.1 Por secretion system C-terminal sorting domain-containing protein [Ekhidna lutea]
MKALLIKITIGFIALLSSVKAHSQENHKTCGTILTEESQQLIADHLISPHRVRISSDPMRLAIKAHIIRKSDGTGGLSESQLTSALEKVNNFYGNAGLEFFLFGDIDYVDNDEFYDFNSDSEQALANERDVPNTINIYFANTVTSGSDPLCGYAYFPGNPDRILMDNSCTVNGTTLSHEIGHYLTLYHTHGKTNNGTTDELVDGSNCETAGDDVCDTPADPNLTGKVNSNCQYTGNLRDTNGDLYQPNTENVMSYAPQDCRRIFSTGQYSRAFSGYMSFRSYLNQKNYAADFGISQSIACAGEEVELTNMSLGNYESIEWRLPEASVASTTDENPRITYSSPGTYDVELTINGDDGGTDIKLLENAVKIIPQPSSPDASLEMGFEMEEIDEASLHSPGDTFSFSIENAGSESEQSFSMQFHGYENRNAVDYYLLSPLENPGEMDYVISFDYAFTYFSDGTSERIDEINILSKGCGPQKQVWSANGKTDATANAKSQSFVPKPAEWNHVETYVPFDPESNFVQLFIEAKNSNGNNFYIDNLQISYTSQIVIRSIAVTAEQCAGDQNGVIEVDASFNGNEISYSLDGENYQSSGLFEGLSAGDYEVFVKSGNDIISESVSVNVISQKPAKPSIIFSNNELRLLASAFEIEWYHNEVLIDDSGATKIPFAGNGDYYVIVRNKSGCENISDVFTVLGSEMPVSSVSVYPNPASEKIIIETVQGLEISIYDLTGRIFVEASIIKGITELSLNDMNEGVYLVRIISEDGIETKKIVIDH